MNEEGKERWIVGTRLVEMHGGKLTESAATLHIFYFRLNISEFPSGRFYLYVD